MRNHGEFVRRLFGVTDRFLNIGAALQANDTGTEGEPTVKLILIISCYSGRWLSCSFSVFL